MVDKLIRNQRKHLLSIIPLCLKFTRFIKYVFLLKRKSKKVIIK